MNLNRFTQKAQDAVLQAQHLAEEMNHSQIEAVHLLAALLAQENGVVPQIVPPYISFTMYRSPSISLRSMATY